MIRLPVALALLSLLHADQVLISVCAEASNVAGFSLSHDTRMFSAFDLAYSGNGTFLHIPKTGGSSMEAMLLHRGIRSPKHLISREFGGVSASHSCHVTKGASIKHFTPEQMLRCKVQPNLYEGKTVFCIVRDPVERLISEFRYREMVCNGEKETCDFDMSHFGRAEWGASLEEQLLAFASAVAFYVSSLRRSLLGSLQHPLNEHLLHVQPQAWYVFDERGNQTCQKVHLMERENFRGTHRNRTNRTMVEALLSQQLKEILQEAYRGDFLLLEKIRQLESPWQGPGPEANVFDDGAYERLGRLAGVKRFKRRCEIIGGAVVCGGGSKTRQGGGERQLGLRG
mmetsp:Transcript_31748/g.90161  ORF Transcript_31748/g.90161 Transcript_31748/m.90161 type:complete len:341 (-) Transcript_31748:61-1083(-)